MLWCTCSVDGACLIEERLPTEGVVLIREAGGLDLPQPFWGLFSTTAQFGSVGDLWLLLSETGASV